MYRPMKTVLLTSIIFLFQTIGITQFTYDITILNTQGNPIKGIEVSAENETSKAVLKEITDASGKVTFVLTEAGNYQFSYLDQLNFSQLALREGSFGEGAQTVTYDPKKIFATKPKADRKSIAFQTKTAQQLKGMGNIGKVTLSLNENSGTAVTNAQLTVVDILGKTKYIGRTNAAGQVVYYLPINRNYEIDVEGIAAYQQFKLPNYPNIEYNKEVVYERTKVNERIVGDTIFQEDIVQTIGSSSHVLFKLDLTNYSDEPLANEPIYADEENGSRVYAGQTDENGFCQFMLQKGQNYIINFKHERGVHLVNAKEDKGFSGSYIARRYRGSAAIERMLAQRELSDKGFVVRHEQTPTRTAAKPTDYLTKTAQGFDIDFASSGPIGTPTLHEDKLYTQQGFYSPNFYCLSAKTGQYEWGVELGETGMSPAVYHKGVILINTYSCTLYALDAETGELLWSKWLAGTIYSTPSASENSVYVVYNNGGSNPDNPAERYVITSFDLRTGELNWINWVDQEVIACPVVADDEVHVVSQSGNYKVFDAESGKVTKESKELKAITSPTITEEEIFLTVSQNNREKLVALDRKTLKVKRNYPGELQSNRISDNGGAYNTMSYNGARPINYKNEVILLVDSTKIVAYDAQNERELWTKRIKTNPSQVPVVANDKVYVASESGKVLAFHVKTGAAQVVQEVEGKIDGQPIARNGLIYMATTELLIVLKTLSNFNWEQWNKDAKHNGYIK
jgi:outer membrane protein assembly factor BamB